MLVMMVISSTFFEPISWIITIAKITATPAPKTSLPLNSFNLTNALYEMMSNIKEYMKENRKLDAEYSEFVKLGGETYPSALNFNILAEEPFGMSINYSRVELNQPMSSPFSIPGNYKRIR